MRDVKVLECNISRKIASNPWADEELEKFLAVAVTHRLYAMYALVSLTGLGRAEAAGLRWSDVALQNGKISIEQTIVLVKGRPVIKPCPKTEASQAEVTISPAICDILTEHRKRQQKERWTVGSQYQDHDLVFCQIEGRPFDVNHMTRNFRALCKKGWGKTSDSTTCATPTLANS